jgi:Zn-dependent peptidase ImmA (M78 family)
MQSGNDANHWPTGKIMSPNEEIEGLAEALAKEFWKDGRVNPSDIATSYGLTFNFGHYEDYFDGLLECKSQRFHVYLNLDTNKSAESPRARFSFAHELGHYFLDGHRRALEHGAPSHGSKADFESNNNIEREADLFAANLLLPQNRFRAAASRSVNAEELRRLAQQFGTSFSATAIRYAKLDIAPVIVMRWTPDRRAWCWSSSDWARQTGNRAFRDLDRIPDDSATRTTLGAARPNEGTIHAKGTTLATWFPFVRNGSAADELLIEECLDLGPHGVLTILRPDRR